MCRFRGVAKKLYLMSLFFAKYKFRSAAPKITVLVLKLYFSPVDQWGPQEDMQAVFTWRHPAVN